MTPGNPSLGQQNTSPGDELPEGIHSLGDLLTQRQRKRFKTGDHLCGRYRIIGELGQGGMGLVFKCLDEVGGVEVAVKMLPPEVSHDTGEMEEVRENFQLVSKLIHPNIATVRTLEKDVATGEYLLVMDCAPGMNLRKWRKEQGVGSKRAEVRDQKAEGRGAGLALEQVQPVLGQMAAALDYAHAEKVIHRDIKPANVMVAPDGRVRILDFGLAAQIHTSFSRVSQVKYGTSGTGPYMAPEQWEGDAQDAATDQYALAVTAYELLAGRCPFESPDASVLRQAVLQSPPKPIPGLPAYAWSALQRALAKKREDRFGSCVEFVEALGCSSGAQRRKTTSGSSGGRAPEPQGKVRKSLGLVIGLGLVLAGGWWAWMTLTKAPVEQAKPAPAPAMLPPVSQKPPDVAVAKPETAAAVPVRLTVTPPGSRISLFGDSGLVTQGVAGADGLWETAVLPGHYEVEAQRDGYQILAQSMAITGALYQALELIPLRGALTVTTVPAASIVARRDGNRIELGRANGQGVLLYERLVEGGYDIVALHDNYFGQTNRVDIRKDRPQQVDLRLQGRPGSAYVSASPQAEVWVDGVKKGMTGEPIGGLPPGTRKFEVRKAGYRTERFSLEIPPNQAAPRRPLGDLVGEAGSIRVRLTVPAEAKSHFQGVEKRIRVGSNDWKTTAESTEIFGGLPCEKQTVSVDVPGYEVGRVVPNAPDVLDNQTTDVEVALAPKAGQVTISVTPPGAAIAAPDGREYPSGQAIPLAPFVDQVFRVSAAGYAVTSLAVKIRVPGERQTAAVALVKARGPVEGQDWVSPSTGMEFVWIQALKMWVGKYEVTNGEYRKVKTEHNSGDYQGRSLNGERQPVVRVNFDEAKQFAVEMTRRDAGDLAGCRYRLPSEDEWMTYAQCGDGREFPWGNRWPPVTGQAGNYAGAETTVFSGWSQIEGGYRDGYEVSCEVEKSWANPWGLYGVGGNVWEICANDAGGNSFGAWRGASWNGYFRGLLRCASRDVLDGGVSDFGFRVVLVR